MLCFASWLYAKARWDEKYDLEDFKYVHRIKFEEWDGTDYAKHLTPATLYRESNFAKYRAQKKPDAISKLSPAGQVTARNMKKVLDRMEREDAENEKIG